MLVVVVVVVGVRRDRDGLLRDEGVVVILLTGKKRAVVRRGEE